MLDPKRLAKIKELANNAQYGYAVVNNQIYHKDVSELLEERDELLLTAARGLISEDVIKNLEQLKSVSDEQRTEIEEQRLVVSRQADTIKLLQEADKKAQHKMRNLMQYNETLKQLVEVLNDKKPKLDDNILEALQSMSGTVGED